MAESATMGRSTESVTARTDARRAPHRALRAELAYQYELEYGHTCRRDTLDALEAMERWWRRIEAREGPGPTFVRSIPQMARGIGWETCGGAREDHDRFRNSIVRRLEMMRRMGRVESYEPLWKDNREGRGILVALRRDSSVGEALARSPRRPPRRPGPPSSPAGVGPGRRSSSRRVSPPLREKDPCNGYKGVVVVEERQSRDARARRLLRGSAQITGHVARHLSGASEESGSELVQASPWLADVPVACLLRGAVLAFAPRPGSGWAKHWSVRLSESARLDAERHAAMLDRYDGQGAGAAAIIDLAAGGWRIHRPSGRPPRFPEPRTPGLLTRGLRKRARLSRDLARFRRDYAADGSS